MNINILSPNEGSHFNELSEIIIESNIEKVCELNIVSDLSPTASKDTLMKEFKLNIGRNIILSLIHISEPTRPY